MEAETAATVSLASVHPYSFRGGGGGGGSRVHFRGIQIFVTAVFTTDKKLACSSQLL